MDDRQKRIQELEEELDKLYDIAYAQRAEVSKRYAQELQQRPQGDFTVSDELLALSREMEANMNEYLRKTEELEALRNEK